MRQDWPYYCLLTLVLMCGIAYAASLVPADPVIKRATFTYAQGYYGSIPRVGRARIVPLARSALKSPVSDMLAHPDPAAKNSSAY